MKHRFTIVKLEERIAPTPAPGTGIFHENCPPGLEKKAGDAEIPPIDICNCTMWNDRANGHSRVNDTFDLDGKPPL